MMQVIAMFQFITFSMAYWHSMKIITYGDEKLSLTYSVDTYCKCVEKTLCIIRDDQTAINSLIVKVKIYLKSKIIQLKYHYLINSDFIILHKQK